MRIDLVVGARPNFVKAAPLLAAFDSGGDRDLKVRLVHTGQHYDESLSGSFFEDLEIRSPDVNLGIGSGTHAEQTGRTMIAFEQLLLADRPDRVVVLGDVNSTLACALAAAKLQIPIAHVEAGLRSFDRSMPEEINRVVTDALSDMCFTTTREAGRNLLREGSSEEQIHFTGNVMIDALVRNRSRARRPPALERLSLPDRGYALLTLHRSSNVDRADPAARVVKIIRLLADRIPVVFPAHPRTTSMLERHGLIQQLTGVDRMHLVDPLPYLEFLYAMEHAAVVLTDSGGIQEETTILHTPCLTLRTNTERAITVEEGTNRLVGLDAEAIGRAVDDVLAGRWPQGSIPELWDGRAADRIVSVIARTADPAR